MLGSSCDFGPYRAQRTAGLSAAGDRKLNKAKSTGRIDGMVALVMAMGVASAKTEAGPSVYEGRGLLSF